MQSDLKTHENGTPLFHPTPQTGGLNHSNIFLTVLEAASPTSRCWSGGFPVRPSWPADGRLLHVSSHGLPSVRVHTQYPFLSL